MMAMSATPIAFSVLEGAFGECVERDVVLNRRHITS